MSATDAAAAARTGAVITWFRPTVQALPGLHAALRDCDPVVVVDNTPSAPEPHRLPLPDSVVYLPQGRNLGLAGALNVGLAHLPADVERVLFLDQDSVLPADALATLAQHLKAPDVAVSAPTPWHAASGRVIDPRRRRRQQDVRARDIVITSGMLARRAALSAAGPFREEFFVDAVDQDMCLRLRRSGWRVLQDSAVLLDHELGDVAWRRVLGVPLRATRHPTWRLYSAARNGAVLLRENAAQRPRWAAGYAAQLAYWLITVLLLEPPRRERAVSFARGFVDGLIGRGSARPGAEQV